MGRHKNHGFTIVELLIVIVVIAILAAITIVAFNGVQQRAKNSAKLSTVESIIKLIELYRSEYGTYPVTSTYCTTTDNKCVNWNGDSITSNNSTLMSALGSYGNVPAASGDDTAGSWYGITYMYSSAGWMFNGSPNPFILMFFLDGTNQDCTGVGGTVSVGDGSGGMVAKPQEKADTGTGQTKCYLMFAG